MALRWIASSSTRSRSFSDSRTACDRLIVAVDEPLSHPPGKLGRTFCSGKLKSKQPPGHCPALADLDQQFGEALRPESLQIAGVESFLRPHVAAGRHCGLYADDLPSRAIAAVMAGGLGNAWTKARAVTGHSQNPWDGLQTRTNGETTRQRFGPRRFRLDDGCLKLCRSKVQEIELHQELHRWPGSCARRD